MITRRMTPWSSRQNKEQKKKKAKYFYIENKKKDALEQSRIDQRNKRLEQEKVPYMCTGQATLYVCRKRYLICVQEKVPYMCAGKGTLYVCRASYFICLQEKVPCMCTGQGTLHVYRTRYLIYICTHLSVPYIYVRRVLIRKSYLICIGKGTLYIQIYI